MGITKNHYESHEILMRYATETGTGNHGMDADLDATEEDLLPGSSRVPAKTLLANISTQDGNPTEVTAPTGTSTIDVTKEPGVVNNEGLSSVSPGSLSPIINEGKKMSLSARIAYVMENGQPFCNRCEDYYLPTSIGKIACTRCGDLEHVEGPTVSDEDAGKDIIKTTHTAAVELNTTDDYINLFNKKIATDSDNYYRGYNDAMNGQELDEDLALLSDDYYNGYEQYKFYNKPAQQSSGQKLYDIKPNSNLIPRNWDNVLTPERVDAGPLQLTDGIGRAAIAGKLPFPIDVVEKFFEV